MVSYALDHEAVIAHECGHAAMAVIQGIVPKSVDVTGCGPYRRLVIYPDTLAGRTDRGCLLVDAKCIMAAWLAALSGYAP